MKTRESIKVLLFNHENALLLMHVDDPTTTTIDGEYYGDFWTPIGGRREEGETLEQTIIREVHEETGITLQPDQIGPTVWCGSFDIILFGEPTHIDQSFTVARTPEVDFHLENLTAEEQPVVQKLAWFTLPQLQSSDALFFPVLMRQYLPPIFAGDYPPNPLQLDLAQKPPIDKS